MSPEIHQTEVDGVRCFWVNSGRPTLTASLFFRAGLVDETFTTHGWHHLLEHSALHGRGGGALSVNGSVTLTATSFDTHGPVERVAEHLGDLTRWLAAPDLSDIERETGVLKAEQRTRGWNPFADALLWRFGATGPGLSAWDEFGLTRADDRSLTQLAQEIFTQGNAVLAMDGPPPPDLILHLPTGPGTQHRSAMQPIEGTGPGLYRSPGLVISGLVQRSWAASLLPDVLETRLRKRFRDRDGASYAPWAVYEVLDDETGVAAAGTDIGEVVAGASAVTAAEIVQRTVEFGAEPKELRDLVDKILQAMNDPYNSSSFAWRAAHRCLFGDEPENPAQTQEKVRALRPEDFCQPAEQVLRTLLVGAPEPAVTPVGHTVLERPSLPPLRGSSFRSRNWPGDRSVITVSDTHVIVTGEPLRGKWIASTTQPQGPGVAFDDLVGVIHGNGGGRVLVARDSWNLNIEPDEWADGTHLCSLLDSRIPADLVVGPLDDSRPELPPRLSWWNRWRPAATRLLAARNGTVLAAAVGVPIGAGFVALAFVTGVGVVAGLGLVIAGRTLYDLARGHGPEG